MKEEEKDIALIKFKRKKNRRNSSMRIVIRFRGDKVQDKDQKIVGEDPISMKWRRRR